MTLQELAKRVQVLEDVEAIKKLKARYAEACDDRYNIEKLAELFTKDMVFDAGEYGVHKGKENVVEFFREVSKSFIFAAHYFISPEIEVEGNKAHGRWYLWQPCTISDKGATWLSGVEDDDYVKIDGKWFIRLVKITIFFHTPYSDGWHKKRSLD